VLPRCAPCWTRPVQETAGGAERIGLFHRPHSGQPATPHCCAAPAAVDGQSVAAQQLRSDWMPVRYSIAQAHYRTIPRGAAPLTAASWPRRRVVASVATVSTPPVVCTGRIASASKNQFIRGQYRHPSQNLLSPLYPEMGINIGISPPVLLASGAARAANYLQRIGRAAPDGNALVAPSSRHPHDLLLLREPSELRRVSPPGCYSPSLPPSCGAKLLAFTLDPGCSSGHRCPGPASPSSNPPSMRFEKAANADFQTPSLTNPLKNMAAVCQAHQASCWSAFCSSFPPRGGKTPKGGGLTPPNRSCSASFAPRRKSAVERSLRQRTDQPFEN